MLSEGDMEVATQALDVEEKDNFGLLWFWKKTQLLEHEMWQNLKLK